MAPIHVINDRGTALTVWKCTCGVVSVGEPDNPAIPRRWHQARSVDHEVRPATRSTARAYVDWLQRVPFGVMPAPPVEADHRVAASTRNEGPQ